MSVFRQSLAYGRARSAGVIASHDLAKGLEYFEWNLAYVYELWEDLFKVQKDPSQWSDKVEYGEIRRIIRRHDQGDGVSERVIVEEAGMKPKKTIQLIYEMRKIGWIYERSSGCWRLTCG